MTRARGRAPRKSKEEPEPRVGRLARGCSLLRRCSGGILAALPFLLILRLVVRDRIFPLNFVFYVPPAVWPMMAVPLVFLVRLPWKGRALAFGATLMLAALALHLDQPRLLLGPVAPQGPANLRVMAFNVKSYSWGIHGIVDTIKGANPDVLCLVEGTFAGRKPDKLSRAMGEDYHWAVGQRLSVASRFPIREGQQLVDRRDGKVFRAIIASPQGDISIYVVDISPPTRRFMNGAFLELGKAIEFETGPAILCGDFNSPRGSHLIAGAVESQWEDCFLVAPQDRVLATWPTIPQPLWQIDHTFARGIRTVSADILEDRSSDHAALVVDFFLDGNAGNE